MNNFVEIPQLNKKPVLTPEMERRMRLIANLIIDRIHEDKKNGRLKLKPNSK